MNMSHPTRMMMTTIEAEPILIKWPFNTLYFDDTTVCHTEQIYITINHPQVNRTRYDWTDPQLIEKLEAIINTIPDKCKTKK
jgi:hypothetical protein